MMPEKKLIPVTHFLRFAVFLVSGKSGLGAEARINLFSQWLHTQNIVLLCNETWLYPLMSIEVDTDYKTKKLYLDKKKCNVWNGMEN